MLKEPKIIFHHIPKCGGTSIVTGLVMAYYPLRYLRYGKKGFPGLLNAPRSSEDAKSSGQNVYSYRRDLLLKHASSEEAPYISGHYPFSSKVYNELGSNWHFITLLRDPVKRFYSEYLWNRYKDHDYKRTELSLEEYIESEQGKMNARSFVNFLSETKDLTGAPSVEDVQESIDTLTKFKVVGCLENLERFRCDLKKAFGRKPLFFNRNSSPAPEEQKAIPDKDSDVYKKIQDMTAADQDIYRTALKQINSSD